MIDEHGDLEVSEVTEQAIRAFNAQCEAYERRERRRVLAYIGLILLATALFVGWLWMGG